ncbi:MAG: PIN domain-containing protein [Planctomycetota bacterium]
MPRVNEPDRIVVDTCVLVAAAYGDGTASRGLMDRVASGEVVLLVSPAMFEEDRFVIPRAVRRPGGIARVQGWLRRAEAVFPEDGVAAGAVPEDRSDEMFLAAAVRGRADAVVSLDRHLLGVGVFRGMPVVRPGEEVRSVRSRANDSW